MRWIVNRLEVEREADVRTEKPEPAQDSVMDDHSADAAFVGEVAGDGRGGEIGGGDLAAEQRPGAGAEKSGAPSGCERCRRDCRGGVMTGEAVDDRVDHREEAL